MRSIFSFAVLSAVIGFSGCCGTGGKCPLKLGHLGQRSAATVSPMIESGDCGCGGAVDYAPAGDCGCGGSVAAPAAGDCGCGGSVAAPAPAAGGCSSCGDNAAYPAPASYAPASYAPAAHAPAASGGCTSCQGASTDRPRLRDGLNLRGGLAGPDGMGMGRKDRGLVCRAAEPATAGPVQRARSLKPKALSGRLGFSKPEAIGPEYDLVSDEFAGECTTCQGAVIGDTFNGQGRHISRGFINDVRNAQRGRHLGRAAGGGCAAGGCKLGGVVGGGGCGAGGCGHDGKLCGLCSKVRGLAGVGSGNPYGATVPHTAQTQGQSGLAPSYAYPYYTTRGPRDFLRDNPPSIGR